MNIIELSLFSSRVAAICDEMGAVLKRAAFSPNIKDRLDFSCAIFDPQGELCAQAAHIPVHLGSMAYAMKDIVSQQTWQDGDMVILNDPFLGGTHLPDVTLIAPVFHQGGLLGFAVNRAHHADIGSDAPGSMPLSTTLEEEGIVIAPTKLCRDGLVDEAFLQSVLGKTANPRHARGDFLAQVSANRIGVARLQALLETEGHDRFLNGLEQLNEYAARLAQQAITDIPDGEYHFYDVLDDDGAGAEDVKIAVTILVRGCHVTVDFKGSEKQVKGNVNCPLSVAAAAVYYVFRCLMPAHTPACAGAFRDIEIIAPLGSVVNAQRPAAVAAGNVETSTRIVDAVMGALSLAIPFSMAAASQGSMNNVAMGSRRGTAWAYYETIGGGMGASEKAPGLSAVQTHMTNTLNTPIESLEMHFPIRVSRYSIRKQSGGKGAHRGGDGIVREYEFLTPTQVTLLTDRRRNVPWGRHGGYSGARGENRYDGKLLPSKTSFIAAPGKRLTIATPGGGGWGSPTFRKS